jgi:hypothetical protein
VSERGGSGQCMDRPTYRTDRDSTEMRKRLATVPRNEAVHRMMCDVAILLLSSVAPFTEIGTMW